MIVNSNHNQQLKPHHSALEKHNSTTGAIDGDTYVTTVAQSHGQPQQTSVVTSSHE